VVKGFPAAFPARRDRFIGHVWVFPFLSALSISSLEQDGTESTVSQQKADELRSRRCRNLGKSERCS
jgi:hypothetical protein